MPRFRMRLQVSAENAVFGGGLAPGADRPNDAPIR